MWGAATAAAKALASALTLLQSWFRRNEQKEQRQMGEALRQGEINEKTLEVLGEVGAPTGADESDRLWTQNSARFARPAKGFDEL